MFAIMQECNAVLKKNGIVGDINTWHMSVRRNRSVIREITMQDGRVFKFLNSGFLKKEKVMTRKQRRALARQEGKF